MHMMLDLETLSTRPNAAVIAIGAVLFDPYTIGEPFKTFFTTIDRNLAAQLGGVDDATLAWWNQQDPVLRDLMLGGTATPKDAYFELLTWMASPHASVIEKVWAKSPQFDGVIIENLGRAIGTHFPVTHRQWLDVRTIDWAAEVYADARAKEWDARVFEKGENMLPPHHALGDAIRQAVLVQSAYQLITRRRFSWLLP